MEFFFFFRRGRFRTSCVCLCLRASGNLGKRESHEGNQKRGCSRRRGARRTCDRFVIPSTKHMASRMLLFPEPFKPVMALNRGSNAGTTVRCAYDLNPSMHTSSTYMTQVPRVDAGCAQRSRREREGLAWRLRRDLRG